jgi:uncharacterized ferritin-like protein (DUF455 family)
MAEKTAGDVLERMALVPRVLEARGLDVTPGMIGKFRQAGDADAADMLEVIYEEEIGHVQAGTRWFRHVCRERGLDPETAFIALFKLHFPAGLKGPVNIEARKRAGFTMNELERAQEAAA